MRRTPLYLAAILGLVAAGMITVLMQLSLVWVAILIAGLAVLSCSFIVPDQTEYWMAMFVLSLPLNVTKMFFFEPEDVAALKAEFGISGVENLVPLMYACDLPLMVLLGIWLGEILSRKQRVEIPRGLVIAAVFIVWTALTLVVAESRLMGVTWIIYQVKMVGILVCIVNLCRNQRMIRVIASAMVVGLAIQAPITMYSYAFQLGENIFGDLFGVKFSAGEVRRGRAGGSGAATVYEERDSILRGTGTIGAGNEQAKYFGMVMPLALVSALYARNIWFRIFSLGALAAGLGGLYLTFSRGGLITGAAALCVVLFFLGKRGFFSRQAFLTSIAVSILAIIAASPEIYDFFTTRPGYFLKRFDQIEAGLQIASEHPLFGVGINNFNVAIPPEAYGGVFLKLPIHNHYVRLLAETGITGIALYLAFFAWVWYQGLRCTLLQDRYLAAVGAALLGSLSGIFIYWLDDIFYGVLVRSHIWLLMGAILAVLKLGRAGEAGEGAPAA